MSDSQWHYADSTGEERGPVDAGFMQVAFRDGRLHPDTLVWRDGLSQRVPLHTVAAEMGLGGMVSPTSPPPMARCMQAAPHAKPQAIPVQGDIAYAGFLRRFAAVIVDSLLLAIPLWGIAKLLAIPYIPLDISFEHLANKWMNDLLRAVVYWLLLALYHAIMESSARQATFGKLAVGIKVTDNNGARLSFRHALLRGLARGLSYPLTLYVGYLMAGFTDRKRGLHDMVAGTLVVDKWAYTEFPERQQRTLSGRLIAGVSAICLLDAAFICFELGLFTPGFAEVKRTVIAETPLVDLAGHKHSFHELRGRATTIYFWATFCAPCLKHMSELANGQRLPANEPFLPVAVEENPQAVVVTLKRLGYRGPVWVATDGMELFFRRFAGNEKRVIPFVVKLDAAGRILWGRYDDPAVVIDKDPMKACGNESSDDTKSRVADCTAAILSGKLSEEQISYTYRHRASAYLGLKDYQRALADLDGLIARQPNNARALAERGNVHERMGDHDLAVADLERSIQLDGGSYYAFGNLGEVYFSKRDFNRAEVSYGHAIDMGKGFTQGWADRCFTRAIIGKDFDAALADCNEAMKLASRESGSLPHLLSYRCFAQYRMKHYREAVGDCDAAIAHDATFDDAFYVRGLAKRALGDASASDDIGHAKKLNPKIAETYAGWGAPEAQ